MAATKAAHHRNAGSGSLPNALFFLGDHIPSTRIKSEIFGDTRVTGWQGDRSSTGFDNIYDPQQKLFLNLQEGLRIMSEHIREGLQLERGVAKPRRTAVLSSELHASSPAMTLRFGHRQLQVAPPRPSTGVSAEKDYTRLLYEPTKLPRPPVDGR